MKLRFVTLLTLLLLISSNLVKAQVAYPRFQKHTVLEGETAKDVVEHFNVTLQDFCLLNDFPENVKLKEGQVVLIKLLADGEQEIVEEAPLKKVTPVKSAPVKAEVNEEPKKEAAKPVAEEKAKPAPVKAAPVVVEKTKLAPTIKEVAEEPFVVPPPSTKAVEIGPRGVVYNVSKGEYHTVAKGQTFFRVALIYGMSVDELKELNGLENTTIEIGQKLKVRK